MLAPPSCHVALRLPRERQQPGVQVLARKPRAEPPLVQRARREVALDVLAGTLPVQLGITRAHRILVNERKEGEALPRSQGVLQRADIGDQQRNRLLRVAEVQKPVAQRQVEQLLLPALDASLRVGRLLLDHVARQHVEVRRRRQRRGLGGLLRRVRRGRRDMRRERPDPRDSAPRDVHGEAELVLARLRHLIERRVYRRGKAHRRPTSEQRSLEQDQLLRRDRLADLGHVGLGHRREPDRPQPDAGEGMAFGEHDHRVQARRLSRPRPEAARCRGRWPALRP